MLNLNYHGTMKNFISLLFSLLAFNLVFAQFTQPVLWNAETVVNEC